MYQADLIRALGADHANLVIDRVNSILLQVNSDERLDVLLALTRCKPASVFWPVFLNNWSHCDDTWHLRARLLKELRRHNAEVPGASYLSANDRVFLDGLPNPVQVFRGCSRPRALGTSWTTDRTVASGFAAGHRGVGVPSPVIVSGIVSKRAIFVAMLGRNESELVLDPAMVSEREIVSPRGEGLPQGD